MVKKVYASSTLGLIDMIGALLSSQRTLAGQVMVQLPLLNAPRSVKMVNTNALFTVSGGLLKVKVVL